MNGEIKNGLAGWREQIFLAPGQVAVLLTVSVRTVWRLVAMGFNRFHHTIHFDIHRNVNYFSNHKEMIQKLKYAITKNKIRLFKREEDNSFIKKA